MRMCWLDFVHQTEGWLSTPEALALHRAALEVHRGNILAVEIGSFKGKSTIAIASAIRIRGGRLIAIDPHTGSIEHRQVAPTDTYDAFLSNIEGAGVSAVVEPVRAYSHVARPHVSDGSVSLLFVDGSHEYDDVLQDIADWLPALRPDAVVAFNDYEWPGVNRALFERIAVAGGRLTSPRFVRGSLFFVYRGRLSRLASKLLRLRLRTAAFIHKIKLAAPRPALLLARRGLSVVRGS